MGALLSLSRGIDAVTAAIGRWVYWLVLAAVLVSAGNAVVRKLFDISSNAWLELQWYLFGAGFMLPARGRNWIDVIGHVFFLLPLTIVMIWRMGPWVIEGIRSGEISASAGGL